MSRHLPTPDDGSDAPGRKVPPQLPLPPSTGSSPSPLEACKSWVEQTCRGEIVSHHPVTGGNRYRSWIVDIATDDQRVQSVYLRHQMPRPPSAEPYTLAREAEVYRAIDGRGIRAPRLIAMHQDGRSMLSERVSGRSELRRLKDASERTTVVQEFIAALADLHKLDISHVTLDGLDAHAQIADCVGREIATWQAMYAETGRRDPLIDLALAWLTANLPRPDERPVLTHGDAGPGNFLFENGHMTALLDWELAHLGDPMEDIAWFSMRCVMEPVPGFAERLAEYERAMGRRIDRARVLYHRVLVSTRVVIIRHRNVTGEPGNSIVSRGLNRRLLVDALAEAAGVILPPFTPIAADTTTRSELYDGVVEDLRVEVAESDSRPKAVAAAKNAAKVLKYLRECDRLGGAIEAADLDALAAVLGTRPTSVETGQVHLVQRWTEGRLPLAAVLTTYSGIVQRAAQLAAPSSGGIAGRTFPTLP